MTEYIRFPTVEAFERFLYTVAYSPRVPAHVKLKKSKILIWRDYKNNFLRISLSHPIYSGIVQQFLRENEKTKLFRPTAYYVLQLDRETNRWDQLFMVQGRIAQIHLGEPTKLNRACQILKEYLYYSTFTRSLEQPSYHNRRRFMDCLEAVQGFY
jgi:hypothetical protein